MHLAYAEPEWLNDIDIEDPLLPWEESAASILPPQGGDKENAAEVEQWILRCAELAKDYELQETALAEHIKELTAKKKRKEIAADRLRRLARREMLQRNWQKLKNALCTLSITKARESLQVMDATQLPDEFVRVERKPLLAEMQKHFKETGELPDGTDLVTGEPGLTIRWS